ncbi:MAG: hypothetical protein LBB85_06995 [Dysgonamonadaceae bacterium]|jgi:hypothetical protein|nr:hypothetical protein [Dysgonamonadaceae bacterium]
MLKKTLLFSLLFFFVQISYAFKYKGITIDENESFERVKTGETPSSLKEISGMACSRTSEGYLWVHVDGGNSEIYALNPNGSIKQTVKLGGISKNDDWEDICMATVDGDNYVLVGCIGDNKVKDGDSKGKQTYYIYRFKEPVITGETVTIPSSEIETITFTYDGLHNQNDCKDKVSHNAETLMFDPVKKKIYVATKHKKEMNALYTMDWKTGSYTTVMNWVCDLGQSGDKFLYLTAGDISADGQKVLIKNASDILYWLREGEEDLSATVSRQPQHIKAYKEENQGEAMAWDNNNRDFYTTGEGKSVPVYTYVNTDSFTGFHQPEDRTLPVRISGNYLFIDGSGQETISLYSLSGLKIRSGVSNTVDVTGLKGIYIVTANERIRKVSL